METFADMGLKILKRSVLDALSDTGEKSLLTQSLSQTGIRERLGIPKPKPSTSSAPNCLIIGVLDLLYEDGYVEALGNGYWKITEAGKAVIASSQPLTQTE